MSKTYDVLSIGVSGKVQKEKERCPLCKRRHKRYHFHHVTYEPIRTERICSWCHEKVTRLNAYISKQVGHKLSTPEREGIWNSFKKNPRMWIPDNYHQRKQKGK